MKKILFTLFFVSLNIIAFGQENPSHKSLENTNVEQRMFGYYPVGSKVEDRTALGGFWASQNFPKNIDPKMNVRPNEISLIALPAEEIVFDRKYRGMKLLLVNTTNEQAAFSATDSHLNIVQEALDRNGEWKAIEFVRGSDCGNSYHKVFLGVNQYWEIAAARYTGEFKTKLRLRLIKSKTEQSPIYSNEFEGSVNQKQFGIQ